MTQDIKGLVSPQPFPMLIFSPPKTARKPMSFKGFNSKFCQEPHDIGLVSIQKHFLLFLGNSPCRALPNNRAKRIKPPKGRKKTKEGKHIHYQISTQIYTENNRSMYIYIYISICMQNSFGDGILSSWHQTTKTLATELDDLMTARIAMTQE